MKTVGLLTYHWVSNFGAQLQTLSTIGYLRKHGCDTVVINWVPKRLYSLYLDTTSEEQLKVHKDFQQFYGTVSPICYNDDDVCKVISDYKIDLVVIGSDSVLTYRPYIDRYSIYKWGFKFVKPYEDNEFPSPYWGSFLYKKEVPTAMMSVAAQNTNYPHILFRKNKFHELLKKLSYISVRDIWTQRTIQYLTKSEITPKITPDPVFSFNQNLAEELVISKDQILEQFGLPDKYIIVCYSKNYFGDGWLESLISRFHESGYTVVTMPRALNTAYSPQTDINLQLPITPLEWYYIIKYSSGYIGELMHALLVSLHNSVPVFSIDEYGMIKNGQVDESSSKIAHILEYYGLTANSCNVRLKNAPKPSAEFVYEQITAFDRKHCEEKSRTRNEEYNKMMQEILSLV